MKKIKKSIIKNFSLNFTVFDAVEDLKSINPNAFWNGLLDENGSLLDVIDSKKQSTEGTSSTAVLSSTTNLIDRKPVRRRSHLNQRIGYSTFNVQNLHGDDSVFVKNEPKDETSKQSISQTDNNGINSENPSTSGIVTMVKKEYDGIEIADTNAVPNNNATMEIQIKDEPIDEPNTSNIDEQSIHVRQQIVPVIKTEIGNSVPMVSNAALQRPITIQQTPQLQQQSHQTFATNDQTLILSSRSIRRLTANGPADGKAGKFKKPFKFENRVLSELKIIILNFRRNPTFIDKSKVPNDTATING